MLTTVSYRLSSLGLRIVVHKLIVETLSSETGPHSIMAQAQAGEFCVVFARFVEGLIEDESVAWSPCGFRLLWAWLTADSSHHISNAISLLLTLILHGSQKDVLLPVVSTLVSHLVTYVQWDIFDAALRRSFTLLLVASRQVPELLATYRAVETALHLEVVDHALPLSADSLLASLLDMSDLSWLDSGLLLGALDGASSDIV